jgi:hypothetical protein
MRNNAYTEYGDNFDDQLIDGTNQVLKRIALGAPQGEDLGVETVNCSHSGQ